MTGDSDDVELRHKSGESLELQTSASNAQQSQSTTVAVSDGSDKVSLMILIENRCR